MRATTEAAKMLFSPKGLCVTMIECPQILNLSIILRRWVVNVRFCESFMNVKK